VRRPRPWILLPLLALACRTEVHQTLRYDLGASEATWSAPARAWEVVSGGRVLGVVVEFREEQGGRGFHSVRNGQQQELGLVDAHGRAWRFRAHEDEPEWLGSGTVAEGAARILGLSGTATLFEVPLETLAREGGAAPGR
jgi:hypothetical protein